MIFLAFENYFCRHQTCIRLGLALQRLGFRRHDGRTYRTYYAVPTRAA